MRQPPPSPAAECRTAADRLEVTLAGTTGGTWVAAWGEIKTDPHDTGDWVPVASTYGRRDAWPDNAAAIALAHTAARALPALLRATAEHFDAAAKASTAVGVPSAALDSAEHTTALTLARAVLAAPAPAPPVVSR